MSSIKCQSICAISTVKQHETDTNEATGTSHFKSTFATETITLQMTLKRYEEISHSNKLCFSNSPNVSVLMQVTSSENAIWDTMQFLNSLLLNSSAITDRSEDTLRDIWPHIRPCHMFFSLL